MDLTFTQKTGSYKDHFYYLSQDGNKERYAFKTLEDAQEMFCKLYQNKFKCCVKGVIPSAIVRDHPTETAKYYIRTGTTHIPQNKCDFNVCWVPI